MDEPSRGSAHERDVFHSQVRVVKHQRHKPVGQHDSLFRSDVAKDKPSMKVKFDKGEQVRINEGPFANFTGAVDDINEDKQTLKVMVSIFGRSTPVEIEFSKVDKVTE